MNKGSHGGEGRQVTFFGEAMVEAHIMDPTSRSVCVREVQKSLSQSVKRLELKIEAARRGRLLRVQEAVIKSKRGDGNDHMYYWM